MAAWRSGDFAHAGPAGWNCDICGSGRARILLAGISAGVPNCQENDTVTHGRAWVMFACLASLPAARVHAAEIRYDESTRVFELSAQQVTYAFGVNERGELQSLYWGGRRA